MKTITFPAGSIGALIASDSDPGHSAPIAIPLEFRARQSAPAARADERQQRFVRVFVAIGVFAVIAAIVLVAI